MAQREYVTSAVSVLNGDGIVVHVVNDSDAAENTHVTIYMNTGAGASVATDSGNVSVVATWTWGLGFTVSESGEYWVRIQIGSEFLIPKVSFERVRDSIWIPIVTYKPGDFAVFEPQPRKRIW
jgi:hypothetical protein